MRPILRVDNFITFMRRLSWNLGASYSWNPQGLSKAVQRMLYLYVYMYCRLFIDGVVGKEHLINGNQQIFCEMKRPPSLQKWCNICAKRMKVYIKPQRTTKLDSVKADASWLFNTH